MCGVVLAYNVNCMGYSNVRTMTFSDCVRSVTFKHLI